MDCPSPECREELKSEIIAKCDNIKDGIKKDKQRFNVCISERPKIKTLLILCGIFASISIAAGGWIYAGYSNAQETQNKRIEEHQHESHDCQKQVNTLRTDVQVIKHDLETIKQGVREQGTNQDKILEILIDMRRKNNND